MVTPLSLNVTVPVGVPDVADTVAVNETDWLKVEGFTEVASVVVVTTATVTAVLALLLPLRPPFPLRVVEVDVLNQNCFAPVFAAITTLVTALPGGLQFEVVKNVAPAGLD